eukprot:g33158.t1
MWRASVLTRSRARAGPTCLRTLPPPTSPECPWEACRSPIPPRSNCLIGRSKAWHFSNALRQDTLFAIFTSAVPRAFQSFFCNSPQVVKLATHVPWA